MRNFKRFATLAMAMTMAAGSTFSAAAANEQSATGTGDYEGYVEETSVFTVDVPTASAAQFNFFVDPNGLLVDTDFARLNEGKAENEKVDADDFEENATLFFTRTPKEADADAGTDAVVKFGKDSEAITLTNKSSYAVDVEVSATVTGADGITLGTVSGDTTDPTLQLAIVGGADSTSAAITADGGKLTGTIEGDITNFKVQYKDGKYQYALVANDEVDVDAWKTYSFNLTGACGGNWTDAQADLQPTVNLTWKVTDPKAAPVGPTATPASLSSSVTSVIVSGIDNVTLKNVKFFKADNSTVAMTSGTHYSFNTSTGEFKVLKSALLGSTYIGGKFVLTFSDDTTVEIPIVAAE